jgi:phosphatidylserine/phosphatidylglycerophosphate/cardiolipin synthase-like enzyme
VGGDSTVESWFLGASERANPSSAIDLNPDGRRGWTAGNSVRVLVHGSTYFARLYQELVGLGPGDRVWFLEWRGDANQRLAGPGSELGPTLAAAAGRGVDVRGLVWRSHPDQEKFSEQENAHLGEVVNEAGGQVLLDERVRRFGSHHQKLVLIQHSEDGRGSVAFVGGIDLCHGRRDDEAHEGDPQAIQIDRRYGPRPAWHDVQLEIRGPAVAELLETFRERWTDPTPLDHRNPWRERLRRIVREPRRAGPLPASRSDHPRSGEHAVQVLRTYPAKRPPYPFAPDGERSVARAYVKALARARSFVYLEDQYLWSSTIAHVLAGALRRSSELRLIAVVPRYPDRGGLLSGPLNRIGQVEALQIVRRAGGDRVAVYDLENEAGRPIYVHAKVCVIDDVWMTVGSDNLNRRSWTHDSELSCAVVDSELDHRGPSDPGGLGDGARRLARDLRLALWREHLGPGVPEEQLLDPVSGFQAWRRVARSLDAWHETGGRGPKPAGRARHHEPPAVGAIASWWARPLYRLAIDPDGRPRALRRTDGF